MPSEHGHDRPTLSSDALDASRRRSMSDIHSLQLSSAIWSMSQRPSSSLAWPEPGMAGTQRVPSWHADQLRDFERPQPVLHDSDTANSPSILPSARVSESSSNALHESYRTFEMRSRTRVHLPPLVPVSPVRSGISPERSRASPPISLVHSPLSFGHPRNSFARPQQPQQPQRRGNLRFMNRFLAFFGYGTGDNYRKELVSLIWNISFGFVQLVVTLALLIYSGVHRSPSNHSISEWKACNRPLGIWGCLWILKIMLDCPLAYWGWRRDWRKPRQPRDLDLNNYGDLERGTTRGSLSEVVSQQEHLDASVNEYTRHRRETATRNAKVYTRLCFLLNFIIVGWFLLANIFIYTSLNSCRFDSPHLWWLIFSLVCIQYLMITELFILALFAFIIAPLIYVIWSIVLLCLNRHPSQNPHYINPEIEKLPRSVVEEIPLVLYIPCPPDNDKAGEEIADEEVVIKKPDPVFSPERDGSVISHSSLPKQSTERRQRPRRHRFIPFRLLSSGRRTNTDEHSAKSGRQHNDKKTHDVDEKGNNDESNAAARERRLVWEDYWEPGEYPFVRLEENRAACAICLLDFEAPQRRVAKDVIRSWSEQNRRRSLEDGNEGENEGDDAVRGEGTVVPSSLPQAFDASVNDGEATDVISGEDNEVQDLHLEDAGEGPQPLRLLECGHVFHKTCIDPWLVDVSGRCPTCQRPIMSPTGDARKNRRSRF